MQLCRSVAFTFEVAAFLIPGDAESYLYSLVITNAQCQLVVMSYLAVGVVYVLSSCGCVIGDKITRIANLTTSQKVEEEVKGGEGGGRGG